MTHYLATWFVEIFLDEGTVRYCTDFEDVSFDGQTYTGVGDRFTPPDRVKREASLKSQTLTIRLDSSRQLDNAGGDFVADLFDKKWRRRQVRLRQVIRTVSQTHDQGFLVDDERGRIRELVDSIEYGRAPLIELSIESGTLAYLERRMATRTPANQKLVFPDDEGFDLTLTQTGMGQYVGRDVVSYGAFGTIEASQDADPESPPAREMLLGKFATQGSFVLSNTFDIQGSNANIFQVVYALADHQIEGLDEVYIDGQRVHWTNRLNANIGVRVELDGYFDNGVPNSARGWDTVWGTYFDGKPTQVAPTPAEQGSIWRDNRALKGVAYIILEFYSRDGVAAGRPALFIGRGAKLYDRRKDATAGGSGAHRWDDWQTWEYSENPMVAIDHYRMGRRVTTGNTNMWFGVGEAGDDYPYSEFEVLADRCEEQAALKAGGTQNRYAVGGPISAADDHRQNFETMASAMGARVVDQGGRIAIRTTEVRTPVLTITDGDLTKGQPSDASPTGLIDDLANGIEGRFRDENNQFQKNDYPRIVNTTYVDDDGGEIIVTVDLELETNSERAQRLAKLALARARRIFTLEETVSIEFGRVLAPGDWITRQSAMRGFPSGKTFEIERIQRSNRGYLTYEAVEVDPADLAWTASEAADLSPPPAYTPRPRSEVEAPGFTLTALELSANGVVVPGVTLAIAAPAQFNMPVADTVEVEFGVNSGTDTERRTFPNEASSITYGGFLPATVYRFRVRGRLGRYSSDWSNWQTVTTTANSTSGSASVVEWSAITGTGKPDDNADVTGDNTASGIAGQGILATNNKASAALIDNFDSSNLIRDTQLLDAGYWQTAGDCFLATSDAYQQPGLLNSVGAAHSGYGNGTTLQASGQVRQILSTDVLCPVEPGKRYKFACEHVIRNAFTGYFILQADWYDSDLTRVLLETVASGADYRTVAAAGGQSETISGVRTAPTGAVFVRYVFRWFWSTTLNNDSWAVAGHPRVHRAYELGDLITLEDGITPATNALLKTDEGTASGIFGQGIFATLDEITSVLADANNLLRFTSGGLYSGDLDATLGAELETDFRYQGGNLVYRADIRTDEGTAAAIAGQGALATQSSVNLNSGEVTDKSLAAVDASANTKLAGIEPGATVGAELGNNLLYNGSPNPVYRADIRTDEGTAAAIAGQGAGATANSLGELDASSNAKLSGIEASATVGAELETDFRYQGGNLVYRADIRTDEGTAAGIFGQGALATEDTVAASKLDNADFSNLVRDTLISDAGYWSPAGGAFISTTDAYLGTTLLNSPSGMRTAIGNGTTSQTADSVRLVRSVDGMASVEPGVAYRFSVDIGVRNGFTGRFRIQADWRDKDLNRILLEDVAYSTDWRGAAATGYQEETVAGVKSCPAGASFCEVTIRCDWSTTQNNDSWGVASRVYMRRTYSLGDMLVREDGATFVTDADAITAQGTAAGFTGQGALATKSALDYTDPELTGFGVVATLSQIQLGTTYIVRADGTTIVQETAVITSIGVAAAIASQGSQATANHSRGTTRPGSPTEGTWFADTDDGILELYTGGSWQKVADITPASSGSAVSKSDSTTGNTTSGTTWVTVSEIDMTVGTGGNLTFPLGTVSPDPTVSLSSGTSFIGDWRIVERPQSGGSDTVVASGTFNANDTGGGFIDITSTTLPPRDVFAAAVNSGAARYRFQVRRSSGTNDLQNFGCLFAVQWTPSG